MFIMFYLGACVFWSLNVYRTPRFLRGGSCLCYEIYIHHVVMLTVEYSCDSFIGNNYRFVEEVGQGS